MPTDLVSKMTDIESVRDYLENELGEETLMRVYPILRDFGDDILFVEKTNKLCKKVADYLTPEQVVKYQNFFALLIFYDMESAEQGGGEHGNLSAMATLKNINFTANFGLL